MMPTPLVRKATIQLPSPLTSLVGRHDEIATVAKLLSRDEIRLLTLTGPGGVGKTRLAVAAARQLADVFLDDVAFVGLASITEPGLVLPTVAQVLEVRDAGNGSLAYRVATALGARRMLLVLDNFEQVVEAAPILADLLAACPGLKLLVTSRVRLRVSGEWEYPVPPLETAPTNGQSIVHRAVGSAAVRLFVERAQAVNPDFTLTEINARAVIAVCRRVDGLPLALELAAAWVKVLPPPELLARLERRLPLLYGGGREMPARQQTMRATIAWSYDLLTIAEQTLFRRLAVFVGGCTLEAAEAVVGGDVGLDVLMGIAALVDKSLLRRVDDVAGGARYVMLETIREFGIEQLVMSGEDATIRDAHLAWAVAYVEQLCLEFCAPWTATELDRLEPDHENLRAALAWSLTQRDGEAAVRLSGRLRDFWYLRGHNREGYRWLNASLAIGANAPAEQRARALLALGEFANDLGDVDQGTAALQESLALSRGLGDLLSSGLALDLLGVAAEDRGDYAAAERLMTEAREHFKAVGHCYWLISQSTFHLGVIAQGQGNLDLAMARYDEAQGLARAHEDHFNIANTCWYQGLLHCVRGELGLAADALEEAMARERALGSLEGAAVFLSNFAVLANAVDRPRVAARLLGTAASACTRRGLSFGLPERLDYDRVLRDTQRYLGETDFRSAWDVGWSRTIADAGDDVAEVLTAARSQNAPAIPSATPALHGLTPRELEVLRLLVEGRTDKEIGAELFLSHRTVMRHVTSILSKLKVENRTAATHYAVLHDLV